MGALQRAEVFSKLMQRLGDGAGSSEIYSPRGQELVPHAKTALLVAISIQKCSMSEVTRMFSKISRLLQQ